MTVTEAFVLYATEVICFRSQSLKTEEHHFLAAKSLVAHFGNLDISSFTLADVRRWKAAMEQAGRSPGTVRGYLIKLRNVLKHLQRSGIACMDYELITLPKRAYRPPTVLTAAEVTHLVNSCSHTRAKAIISLLYSTGLRVSELCSLNRDDVRNDYFSIVGKGGKSRVVFIDERSRRLLDKYLKKRTDNHPALFVTRIKKERMTPPRVQELFECARVKAGFPFPVTPHTMRHSFATNLMTNGLHIYPLSRMLGHSSIQTTSIYLHVYDGELAEAHKKYHTI